MLEASRHPAILLEEQRPGGTSSKPYQYWRPIATLFGSMLLSASKRTKARGMSSFRTFRDGEASTIVVAWIAAAEGLAGFWRFGHHERIDKHGAGSRNVSRGSCQLEARCRESDRPHARRRDELGRECLWGA